MKVILRKFAALISAWVLVLMLMSCSKEPEDTSEKSSTSEGEIKVVYIPKNTGNPYFDEIVKGLEASSKELGFSFTTIGPATATATSQIPQLKSQIAQRVDVIAISPNSEDALDAVFAQARNRGIKIFVVNSDIKNAESRDLTILPTDFATMGEQQLDMLGSMINYEGDFAIVSATTDAPDQNAWIAGMREQLKNNKKFAKMNLVTVVYGDDDNQKSQTETTALITRYPDLKGIIAPTAVGMPAAAQAVKLAGVYPGGPNARGEGVVLTGMATPNLMRAYVKDGVVQKFSLWKPYDEGIAAGYLAVQMVKQGLKVEPSLSVEIPGLGVRTFDDRRTLIAGETLIFTAENIDELHF